MRAGLEVFRGLGLDAQDLTGDVLLDVRARFEKFFASGELPPDDGVSITDHIVSGAENGADVLVRTYRAVDATGTLPCLYWMHGGGRVFGSVEQDDRVGRSYARRLRCVVASVGYRLAPEHPHPAALDDCYAGLQWTAEHADELAIDPGRIAIGGGSAGGGLAASTALLARDRGGPDLTYQFLIYPMIDDRNNTASAQEFRGIPSWSQQHNACAWSAVLGAEAGGKDVSPYAAPARAKDLTDLPAAFIQVGELEVFRDENIDYAQRLLAAGVSTELHVYPGAYHACDLVSPRADVSVRMIAERRTALQRALNGR